MSCRLFLLGSAILLDQRDEIIPVPAKAFALVARILLDRRGGPVPRARLAQFLWEDADTQTAAANLRQLIARIRERQVKHGFRLVGGGRDSVDLDVSSVRVDLVRFKEMLEAPLPADLVELCNVFSGELLDGAEWDEADFRDWLQAERTHLRNAFVAAVTGMLEPFEADADRMPIRVAARRVLEIDPYNEVAHRALMRLYAEDNEPARIRDLFESLEKRLRNELGVKPDPTTAELYRSLLPAASRTALLRSHVAAAAAPTSTDVPLREQDRRSAAVPTAASHWGLPRLTILPPPPPVIPDYHHRLAVSLLEDVTIGLCRFNAISVIAPYTARQLTGAARKALLRTFGIDYVVETQLRGLGGEYRLSVKLLDANSREIVWTEQYPFDRTQTAQYYNELSIRIVLSLVEKVERAELARYDREQDETAYRLYLTGQRFLRRLDLPNVRRARRAFKAALSSCSTFVPAISGLARTYQREWMLMARGDEELLLEAGRLANRSIETDPDDARGYRELGISTLFRGAFDEGLEALRQAEQRNPQHADLLVDVADALSHTSDTPSALRKITHAIDLNPLCPDQYWWVAGGTHYQMYDYPAAIDCLLRMRDQSAAYRLLAAACAMHGDQERAHDYVRKTKEIHPDFEVNTWLSILPIQDRQKAEHYEQGLRKAGFV